MRCPMCGTDCGCGCEFPVHSFDLLFDIKTMEKLREEMRLARFHLAMLTTTCEDHGIDIDILLEGTEQ